MDDGDEIIVLRVSTIDLSGKKRLVGLFFFVSLNRIQKIDFIYNKHYVRKNHNQKKDRM
jgi:ribosomal protein L13